MQKEIKGSVNILSVFRNKKVQIGLLVVFLLAFYIVAFMPVINSDYMYDDRINYYGSKGYSINHDESVWDISVRMSRHWAVNEARPFIFSGYTYLLFDLVNLKQYKILLVLVTFLNGLLFAQLIQKCIGRKQLAFLTMLLFPVIVSMDAAYCNPMYGFHMLIQLTFIWSLAGILCYQQYLEKGKIFWQVLSCIFLFIALGTYEVAYVLCVLYLFVAVKYKKNFAQILRSLIPQIVIGAVWLGVRIWLASQIQSHYSGTTISIGTESIGGFIKQLSGSSGLVMIARSLRNMYENTALIKGNLVRYGISAVLFLGGFVIAKKVFFKRDKVRELAESRDVMAWLLAIFTVVGPCLLIAISKRYQDEVTWGKGYIPAYVSAWGLSLCIAIILEWVTAKRDQMMTIISALLMVVILIPNQIVGDLSVEETGHALINTDTLFREADTLGMFDDWREGQVILEDEDIYLEAENHYSYLLGYKTDVTRVSSTYTQDEKGKITTTERFDDLNKLGAFSFFTVTNNYSCILTVDGNAIRVTDHGMSVNGTRLKAYIPNGLYTAFETIDDEGKIVRTELTNEMILKKTDRYTLYQVEIPQDMNCLHIVFC